MTNLTTSRSIFEKVSGKKLSQDFIAKKKLFERNKILDHLIAFYGLNIIINDNELKNIPQNTPYIVIANHPHGDADDLILQKIFESRAESFRIFGNLQDAIEPEKYLHQLGEKNDLSRNEYISAYEHINAGKCLGMFPSMGRSVLQLPNMNISDKKWDISALKFLHENRITIVPVYIQANKNLINNGSLIQKGKRTGFAMRENGKNADIKVRIGSAISEHEIAAFDSANKMGRYCRAKVYCLGSALEVKNFFRVPQFIQKEAEKIIEPVDVELIKNEIKFLNHRLCYTLQNYSIYIARAAEMPSIVKEIGRLRELTFREIGEGTNKSFDLDEYDLYYYHMFLWDNEKEQIAGSYRLGKGKEIFEVYGKKGFYTSTLFKFKNEFNGILAQTIELGRSFVVKEYQNKRLPLFMLWKGIMYFILMNPDHRYLLGPVSISNFYSHASKGLIVSFIKKYHFDHKMAEYVKPKKKFKIKVKTLDHESLLESAGENIYKMDKIISDIEPSNNTIPVLLKKYIKQNANIIGFNIDPKFNDALDGLMILDINNAPEETLETMKKDLNIG